MCRRRREVRDVVKSTMREIEVRDNSAVKELAVKFDDLDRECCHLSGAEFGAIIAKVGPRDMEDIRFVHVQVVNVALPQRLPSQISRSKHCLAASSGTKTLRPTGWLPCAGRLVPDVRFGPHVGGGGVGC